LIDKYDIGAHYPETLRRWRANLACHAEEIAGTPATAPLIDDAGLRLFNLYLCYCEAAFLERHIGDVQLVFARRPRRP
jgi:cyclopropane-fatty-acyl-phospholipid synthase